MRESERERKRERKQRGERGEDGTGRKKVREDGE